MPRMTYQGPYDAVQFLDDTDTLVVVERGESADVPADAADAFTEAGWVPAKTKPAAKAAPEKDND